MGSFQQICLGAICLAAAYMFGNYVNNNPPLNSAAVNQAAGIAGFGTSQGQTISGNIAGNIQSRLPISEFPSFENKPAPIVTMKTPLKSRFTVPSRQQLSPVEFPGNTIAPQFNNPLPPPSQLAAPNQLAAPHPQLAPALLAPTNQQSAGTFSDRPFSSRPFPEPAAVSPTVQVPDFSAIAAEFKNTPIELPNMSRLGGMPSHSDNNRLSRPQANHFGHWQNTNDSNRQLKQLVKRLPDNEFRNPNLQSPRPENFNSPQPYEMNVERNLDPQSLPVAPNIGFAQADFEPKLNDDIFDLKPTPNLSYRDPLRRNPDRRQEVSNSSSEGYHYDVPPPVPPEMNISEDRTESGFRGNLTFRPDLENRSRRSADRQINEPQFEPQEYDYGDDYARQMQQTTRSAPDNRGSRWSGNRQINEPQFEPQDYGDEYARQMQQTTRSAPDNRGSRWSGNRQINEPQFEPQEYGNEYARQMQQTTRSAPDNRDSRWSGNRRQINEPQLESQEYDYGDDYARQMQQTTRSVPTTNRGLPFRLTEQAQTELVQLRDRADSMIGSESTNFVDHTIRNGETLQSISTKYFGSPDYYLDIYLANRNKLRNPADAQQGVSIRVPVYNSSQQ